MGTPETVFKKLGTVSLILVLGDQEQEDCRDWLARQHSLPAEVCSSAEILSLKKGRLGLGKDTQVFSLNSTLMHTHTCAPPHEHTHTHTKIKEQLHTNKDLG